MQEQIASLSPVTVVTRTTIVRSNVLAGTVALFAVTMFAGASLLFLVQPMFAKLALPRLGGSPSVWNTCVLFFQATLLLGYLDAHFSTRWLGVRRQVYLHLLLLIVPFVALPLTMGDGQPSSASPIWRLLGTMTLSVGLPFFVASTTAPLLQRWFATLPVPSARDPYFLYAASNLGSMLALLAYLFLLEPAIGTRQQTWLWTSRLHRPRCVDGGLRHGGATYANGGPGDSAVAPAVKSEPLSARQAASVGDSVIHPLELDARSDHLHFDRCRGGSAAVGAAARDVSRNIRPGVFAKGSAAASLADQIAAGSHRRLSCYGAPECGSSWSSRCIWPRSSSAPWLLLRDGESRTRCPSSDRFYIWMSFGGMLGGVFNGLLLCRSSPEFWNTRWFSLWLPWRHLPRPKIATGRRCSILGASVFVVLFILDCGPRA